MSCESFHRHHIYIRSFTTFPRRCLNWTTSLELLLRLLSHAFCFTSNPSFCHEYTSVNSLQLCVCVCVSLPDFKLSANLLYLDCVQLAVPEGPDCMLKVPRATQKPQRMLARPQAPSHQVHFLGAETFRGSSRPAREIQVKCTLWEMCIL